MIGRLDVLAVLVLAFPLASSAAASSNGPVAPGAGTPLIVVLQDTGQRRDGLPVFRRHPNAAAFEQRMQRGFPARIVRLYRLVQVYLHQRTGSAIEPAYLEFSSRQGGFPGFGFWLGAEAKRKVGFVDLYEERRERPRFGSIEQIFPHELAHVMMRQLLGEPPPGNSTQGHAIAVRTDRVMAFNEGFAEHCQVMVLDDPEADEASRSLLRDPYWQQRTEADVRAYREALTARWAPAVRARMGFMFWYSGDEQVMRYHAVKANAFARGVQVPERLLRATDPYAAYLLENTLPGLPGDPPKSPQQLLATEGFVSTLFWRWATSERLRGRYLDDGFYASFATSRGEVVPAENVYLKLLHAFAARKPQTVSDAIAAYEATFPEEAAELESIVREVSLGQGLAPSPEVWLANSGFHVGTRMFDQFRAAPRTHTFDLNAASLVDLVAVPGVSLDLARRIQDGMPYARLEELDRVPGMTTSTRARFRQMAADMARIAAMDEESVGFSALLWSFGWHALAWWAVAAALATWLYHRARPRSWFRAACAGIFASLVTLLAGWAIGLGAALAAAGTLFFLPAVLLSFRRRPVARAMARAWLAWAGATAPALILLTPLF